jgi:tryptophan synthase alpha chain
MSRRYDELFAGIEPGSRGAFVPFATLGDPNHAESGAILDTLVAAGADALELGIAFSDPVADGPVIQAAATRALAAGATVTSSLELVRDLRRRNADLPIGLLLYANLVWSRGLDRFYAEAAEAGVDSVLLADVPLEEIGPFAAAADQAGIAPVLIAPPNATDRTLDAVARTTRGYTYVTTRSGVTGDRERPDPTLSRTLDRLAKLGAPPAVLGFGIATPEQARAGIAAGAAGVIAGSAVVRRIAEHRSDPQARAAALDSYVRAMKAAVATGSACPEPAR